MTLLAAIDVLCWVLGWAWSAFISPVSQVNELSYNQPINVQPFCTVNSTLLTQHCISID